MGWAHLEGQGLRTRTAQQAPGLQEVMRIMMAMAEALAEAHSHGILHRDLKPENVVIPGDGLVRVVDFGLARRVEPPAPPHRGAALQAVETEPWGVEPASGKPAITQLGGTPAYMSPEQWSQEPSSGATDVWALGVMLFELLTGQLPFVGHGLAQLAVLVCGPEEAPRVDQLRAVPPELCELVADCLHKDPARRLAAAAVARGLKLLQHPASRAPAQESLYCGLLPFAEHNSTLYFGREPEVAAFCERARHQPVLPVVGPSGAGKSSFVQAGVIPRLREQHCWITLTVRPGARPFGALSMRLVRHDTAEGVAPPRQEVDQLAARLMQSPPGEHRCVTNR